MKDNTKEMVFSTPDPLIEEILLFSADGQRAVEVTLGSKNFGAASDSVTPIYEGSMVTQPVPVMVEGTYKVFNRVSGRYEDVTFTADDIKEYLRNTPRDVVLNYEHKKGEPVGWLRLKDTAECKTHKFADGEKTALFACMELFPEAADKVRRGIYRDGSIELRTPTKEIIGHALTAFPVMRDTQFFSHDEDIDEPVNDGAVDKPVEQAEINTESTESVPVAENTTDNPAADSDKPEEIVVKPKVPAQKEPEQKEDDEIVDEAELLKKALAKYNLTPEDLAVLPLLKEQLETEQREAALILAREKVKEFSADAAGRSYLSGETLEAAAQLLVFGNEHADMVFGDGENQLNPAGLLEKVLRGVAGVQLFGEVASEDFVPNLPVNTKTQDVSVDEDRVSDLRERIKRNHNIENA